MDRPAHALARAVIGAPARSAGAAGAAIGRRIAVVGAGWAGLAAAVRAVQSGARVTVYEMAHQPGGRARAVQTPGGLFDNGQHVLIGAYTETLALMRSVGADPDALLQRRPLALCQADGRGLVLPAGAPLPAFLRGVLSARGWGWIDRLALLRAATRWRLAGFRCAPDLTVAGLCAGLPATVQDELIEPLCVAALNTPMAQASAQVFLRVLHDALFAGRGSADLLLPRVPLSDLLPRPAWQWLQQAGARCLQGRRLLRLQADGPGWRADDEAFDAVVLACTAVEAARLTEDTAPDWSAQARALRYEPIATAYLRDASLRLRQPMVALPGGADAPAQFIFDLGQLHGPAAAGQFAVVASGASALLSDGVQAAGQALLRQARAVFAGAFGGPDDQVLLHLAAERRATFACRPGLQRPAQHIAPGLVAAGDYVAGPYPATLEGAVRCGNAAVRALV